MWWGIVVEKNWSVSAADVAVFGASHQFAEHTCRWNGFARIQKAVVDQMGHRPTNSDHNPFFGVCGLGKCFGASLWYSHSAGCLWLSCEIHFLLHVTIRSRNSSLLLRFFWFVVSSRGTHLSDFFTFPICFKCQMTIEWSTLSSLATSHLVVRGSALTILSVGRCQLLIAGHCAPHL